MSSSSTMPLTLPSGREAVESYVAAEGMAPVRSRPKKWDAIHQSCEDNLEKVAGSVEREDAPPYSPPTGPARGLRPYSKHLQVRPLGNSPHHKIPGRCGSRLTYTVPVPVPVPVPVRLVIRKDKVILTIERDT